MFEEPEPLTPNPNPNPGRMFETFELPLVEFCAFLRAAAVVAQGGGLLVDPVRGGV